MPPKRQQRQQRRNFASQSALVNYLQHEQKIITDNRVANAMKAVDRADFTDIMPHQDAPQSIQYEATISAPHIHAYALQQLNPNPGAKVLDIGSGSGYLLPAFAQLVGRNGKVIGIEHIKELCIKSYRNIQKHHQNQLDNKTIRIFWGDGRCGYEKEAPYDAIHIGAATPVRIVNRLVKQLKPGGKMIVPVIVKTGEKLRLYTKHNDGTVSFQHLSNVTYVALTSEAEQRQGKGKSSSRR